MSTTLYRALLAIAFTAGVASAAPNRILVLRADGNADAATKAKIDAQVVKLAKSLDGNVEAGEITFGDAAAAVGCSGSELQCRDEVLGTMGVDELVSVNVSAMPSGDVHVVVHRIPKSTPIRDAQTTVPAGQPGEAKLSSDIGPLFGAKPAAAATKPATPPNTGSGNGSAGAPVGAFGNVPASGTAGAAGGVAVTNTQSTGAASAPSTAGTSGGSATSSAPVGADTHTAAPTRTAQVDPNVTAAPNGQIPSERHSSRATAGLAIGGGLVLLAVIMWAEAGSVQGDINNAPVKTPNDFRNLQDLESRGDTYSGLGNLFFIGGVVVGGVSGYFFWRDRRSHASSQASIAPTLLNHGAGVVLTIGGAP